VIPSETRSLRGHTLVTLAGPSAKESASAANAVLEVLLRHAAELVVGTGFSPGDSPIQQGERGPRSLADHSPSGSGGDGLVQRLGGLSARSLLPARATGKPQRMRST
jgi:hypothetical protein